MLFHTLVGVPADDVWANQGIYNRFTMWEQIDRGTEYSRAKKMLTIFPIILYGAQPAVLHHNHAQTRTLMLPTPSTD